MWKHVAVLAGLLAVAGCADMNGGADQARMTAQAPTDAQLAAYAGGHKYPATQPTNSDTKLVAIVDRDKGVIKLYNFSHEPIQSPDLWVNTSFVQHLDGIAPGTTPRIVRFSDLYNSLGQQFSKQNESVRTVQLDSNRTLLTALGPGVN